MFSYAIRLFGQRPAVSDIKEEEGKHGDLPDSNVNCQPSSSKKRREDICYLPDNNCGIIKSSVNSNDKLDIIEIKEELEVSYDDENGNPDLATASQSNSYEKTSELESQLRTAEANLKILQEAASAPLMCSSCKQLPRTLPLFSCTNHHKSCSNCMSFKLSTCPTCSKPLLEESSPLLASLLSSLSRSCTWANMGCNYKSVLEPLLEHEKTCKYQTVLCWGCQEKHSLRAFDKHDPNLACFSDKMVYKSFVKKTLLLVLPKFKEKFPLQHSRDCEWDPVAVNYAGKMFYVRIKRIHNRGVWIFYTAAQLLPASCEHYLSTITLSCPDLNMTTTAWTYTGSPSSLVLGLDKVLKEGKCLIMTDPAMEQLMTVDKLKRGTLFNIAVEVSLNK